MPDMVAFLLRFLKISHRGELNPQRLLENLTGRLEGTGAFNETIKGIWSKVCDSMSTEWSLEASLEPDSLAAAISRGKATVLDLRFLVAFLFRNPPD
jgi:hypothetical protein